MQIDIGKFLKRALETVKPLVTPEVPKPKLSQTERKRRIRAWKTRPRASCDSFRYRQKHQAELRLERRAQQNARRQAKPRLAVMP